MRLRIPLLLLMTMMIGLGYHSTVAAQQPPWVSIAVQLNEDVVCIGCPPGSQPEEWEINITYQVSSTCTRVDTYHAPCRDGCEWTFVGSQHSGSCSGPEPPVAVVGPCPECPEVDNVKIIARDPNGDCWMREGHIVCPQEGPCHLVIHREYQVICPIETNSGRPGPDTPDGIERKLGASGLAELSFGLSSRNPTSESVVFRMGVPEASRGAHEELMMFDLLGRRVRTLISGVATPGSRVETWDLRTDEGLRARPGMYYARYRLGNEVRKQTVVIVL